MIQLIKALLFASPLLIVPFLFIDREIFSKTRVLFLFILLGLFFYILVFDFSIGALDRYLQFLIVPLCVIAGAIFAKYINFPRKLGIIWPILISILLISVQFFNHFVPSLYPKTEWINRALSLKWNFLFPFLGGSGPTPFYVSFLFIALMWVICVLVSLLALRKIELRRGVLLGVLFFGFCYNIVFS